MVGQLSPYRRSKIGPGVLELSKPDMWGDYAVPRGQIRIFRTQMLRWTSGHCPSSLLLSTSIQKDAVGRALTLFLVCDGHCDSIFYTRPPGAALRRSYQGPSVEFTGFLQKSAPGGGALLREGRSSCRFQTLGCFETPDLKEGVINRILKRRELKQAGLRPSRTRIWSNPMVTKVGGRDPQWGPETSKLGHEKIF